MWRGHLHPFSPIFRAPSLPAARSGRPRRSRVTLRIAAPGILNYYTLYPQEKQAQKPATCSDSSKKSVRGWMYPPRAYGVRWLATAFLLPVTSPCRKGEAIAGSGENSVWYGTPCRNRARTLRCRHPLPELSGPDNLPGRLSRHGVPCHTERATLPHAGGLGSVPLSVAGCAGLTASLRLGSAMCFRNSPLISDVPFSLPNHHGPLLSTRHPCARQRPGGLAPHRPLVRSSIGTGVARRE